MTRSGKPKGETAKSRFDMVEVGEATGRRPRRSRAVTLPPYIEQAPCPKCGNTAVSTRYCPAPDMTLICGAVKGLAGEHMHRVCERCAYEWLQACLPGGVR